MADDNDTVNDAPTPAPAPAPAPPAPPPPAAAAETDAPPNPFEKGAVVVAHGAPGAINGRGVVIAESRTPEGGFDEGATYGKADAMVRYDPRAAGAEGVDVLTMGDTVVTGEMKGFTRKAGELNTGPASPVYAAANLAYQRGARDIQIVGLTDREKALLTPWFDIVHDQHPDVTISF